MKIEEIIATLAMNYDDEAPIEVNDKLWTLADLFARQLLNNGGDGFGMVNVREMYDLLCENKQLLLDNNMINKEADNNSGYPLWDNYEFDEYYWREKNDTN